MPEADERAKIEARLATFVEIASVSADEETLEYIKERIAELVLAWLMEVDADRNAKLVSLMASRAGKAGPAQT